MLQNVIVFVFTFLVFCNGENRVIDNYDQILLNQSHPVTEFMTIHKQWPIANYNPEDFALLDDAWATLEKPFDWIITSFRPVKINNDHPENCYSQIPGYSNVKFNGMYKVLLRAQWPIYYSIKVEDNYWKHAWIRYGMCMSKQEETNTINNYISKALEMLHHYNIGTILSNNGITFDKGYKLDKIKNIIKKVLKINVHLKCIIDKDSAGKEQYLAGAFICLNRAFNPEECAIALPSTCDSRVNVFVTKMY